MREIGQGLWEQGQDLKLMGANLGTRMNVAMTLSGLFLHSPIKLTQDLQSHIERIGTPQYIIAPNMFHHMFVGDYLTAYPKASFYTIPELARRRPDLHNPIMIENNVHYPWSEALDHYVFRGGRWFKEVIFYHKASRTLILTDFAFNLQDTGHPLANFFFRITKSLNRFGHTFLERLLIRDRGALRDAYEHIMKWDFERISVAHGHQVEMNGKQVFAMGIEREL